MSKRKVLIKIAALLENYLQSKSQYKINNLKNKENNIVYANAMQILISDKLIQALTKKDARINTSKMTKQAKILINDVFIPFDFCENFQKEIFSQLDNDILKLIPSQEFLFNIINQNTNVLASTLWNENSFQFEAMFIQGRQHRKSSEKKVWQKYTFSQEDSDIYAAFEQVYKRNIKGYVVNQLSEEIIFNINQNYYNFKNLNEIKNMIEEKVKKFNFALNDIFKNELIKIYSMGNLYQIKKEGHKYVILQASQDLNDCNDCRQVQSNEQILRIAHINDNYYNCYEIDDVLRKSLYQGNDFITHLGCRCQFIPIKKGP